MKQQLFNSQKFGILLAVTTLSALIPLSFIYAKGAHKGGHGHDEKSTDDHGGDHHGAGAHWMSPKGEAEKINPVKSDAASIDRGKRTYLQNCASCHGATAMGDGPIAASLNPKPTNLQAMSGGHPDGDFAWKIVNGRGAMPAWKGSILNETKIWELVSYIQSLKGDGKQNNTNNDHEQMTDNHNNGKHSH